MGTILNNDCFLQKRLFSAVFAELHSKAVETSRYSDLFSRHLIGADIAGGGAGGRTHLDAGDDTHSNEGGQYGTAAVADEG